ncbi:MAG TPA: HEPN domain-containing protein [Pseudonocardiaceae bacterium]|jgi:hypothetical protein|nr:HEPN domain-containing protein [Pseudonocardiaceae bacterium]
MPSNALAELMSGLAEIEALQRANPSPLKGNALKKPQIVRAIGRAEIVLLSSHFERYIYAINEEAVEAVCDSAAKAYSLPESLRLHHARPVIDLIAATSWENRSKLLAEYSANEGWLWEPNAEIVRLEASRLLEWMKAPSPKSLVRVFRIWGIHDIFRSITRKSTISSQLRLRIEELVSKRNNIAHGDFTVEATYLDVVQYKSAVRTFCGRVDRKFSQQLKSIIGSAPW